MIVTLTLPYPVQANHMFTVARGRKIISPKYRAWKKLAREATAGHCGAIKGPFLVAIEIDRPDRRKRDLDNLIKPVLDALSPERIKTEAGMVEKTPGVIRDDSDAEQIVTRWSTRQPGKGAVVRVSLWPFERRAA